MRLKWLGLLLLVIALGGCKSKEATPLPGSAGYVLLAWNDLGMHCLSPSFDTVVVLPPYNTLWAQLIEKGNPPRIVSSGFTVEYRIINNTYSYGKRSFGQFWDNSQVLFGVALPRNLGLNLVEPDHAQRAGRLDGGQGRSLRGGRHPADADPGRRDLEPLPERRVRGPRRQGRRDRPYPHHRPHLRGDVLQPLPRLQRLHQHPERT